jgi:hypothetical protein
MVKSDFPWAGGFGVGTLVAMKFSAPVQTSPKTHPAFCALGAGSLS